MSTDVLHITIDPDLAIKHLTKLSQGWDRKTCDDFLNKSFCMRPLANDLAIQAESIIMEAYNKIVYAVATGMTQSVQKYAKHTIEMLERAKELFALRLSAAC